MLRFSVARIRFELGAKVLVSSSKILYFFLNLGGVGAKTRFLSKKNWGRILSLAGKILGQLALYTWVLG